jgi:hypothetical protein
VLSAFATTWSAADAEVSGVTEGAATAANTYDIGTVDSGSTVFFVKTNKLLDGAKIQASTTSCVPAPEVALTVNGAAVTDWFTCYYPNTSTSAEGASVVIYQGVDVGPLTGYFDSADLVNGFYTIALTITDKQGNTQDVTINAGAKASIPYMVDVTPTGAVVTWPADGARVTAYVVQKAPNVPDSKGADAPGTFAPISGDLAPTVSSFTDPATLTAETKYWYRVVAKEGTTLTAISDPGMILTAATPGAATLVASTTPSNSIAVTWTQVASKVESYLVERTTTPADATSWTVVGTKSPSTTTTTLTFTDLGTTKVPLVNGTTYHYRIKGAGTDYETRAGPATAVLLP